MKINEFINEFPNESIKEVLYKEKVGIIFKKEVVKQREIRIHRKDKQNPYISFLFEVGEQEPLIHLKFSTWHNHYDGFFDYTENLNQAINLAHELIDNKKIICISHDQNGKYSKSQIVDKGSYVNNQFNEVVEY